MKKIMIPILLLIITAVGCQSKKENDPSTAKGTMKMKKPVTPRINISEKDLADEHDPVCGMPAFKFMTDTAMVGKKIYGFCGAGCKDEFKKNTAQYVKK